MATIKIFDLGSTPPISIDSEDEFLEAVKNSTIRALDARQQQDIRGGVEWVKAKIPCPIIVGMRIAP
jgi:hypothetical protein